MYKIALTIFLTIKFMAQKTNYQRSGRKRAPAILAVGGKREGVAKREPP